MLKHLLELLSTDVNDLSTLADQVRLWVELTLLGSAVAFRAAISADKGS